MKKLIKPLIINLLLLFAFVNFSITSVKADTPYKTYTQDGYSNYVETQTAYTSVGSITKVGDLEFSAASDLKMGKNGYLYICDTGNKRVIVSTKDGELVKIIGEGVLESPKGIFVTYDNSVYVADDKKEKVFVFSENGELLKEYGKPDSPLFGKGSTFKPQKLVVDKRGNIYVVSEGNSNGIIQLSTADNGSFLGYFGTNDTRVSLLTLFRKAIFTEEQEAKMVKSAPVSASNLSIDNKGLIYTISQGEKMQTLKKLNMAGKNIINATVFDQFPAAVTNGPLDNIFVVSKDGFIYEYNSEGSLLFVFGGKDDGRQRVGLFKLATGIALDENEKLYVLDAEANKIEVFETTEFADLVHKALDLYQNGYYEESKGPWTEVLKMNSLFDFANLGMGEALFKEENYKGALQSYRLAKYKIGYSDAFWEIRNVWMRNNVGSVILYLIALAILLKIIKFLDKKFKILKPLRKQVSKVTDIKIIKQVNYVWHFLKHPTDGFYGIKRENRVGYLSATILYFIYFVISVLDKYASGFIFRRVQEGRFDIFMDFYNIFSVFFLMIICNYLVSAINDGEVTFKNVYCGFIYSFAPYFLIKPFIIVLTNVFTNNERFILGFGNFVINAWIVILVIKMIKDLNDYTMKETIKVILLTAFTILIMVLVLFIVYVLLKQVVDFITSIFGEAVYRIANS